MTRERRRTRAAWATVLGAPAGPALAGLHETGGLSVGPAATLWPIVVIVIGATAGVVTGLRLARRGASIPGVLVTAVNLVVLLFYGFLLAFFGMGGSR